MTRTRSSVSLPSSGAAVDYRNSLSSFVTNIDRESLGEIRDDFGIPVAYSLSVCGARMSANENVGDGKVIVYKEQFRCGLRFPLDPLIESFVKDYGIPLGQIHPNAIRVLCCFIELVCDKGLSPSLGMLNELFFITRRSNEFYHRLAAHRGKRLIDALPKITKRWQRSFFVVGHDSAFANFPCDWVDESESLSFSPLCVTDSEALDSLVDDAQSQLFDCCDLVDRYLYRKFPHIGLPPRTVIEGPLESDGTLSQSCRSPSPLSFVDLTSASQGMLLVSPCFAFIIFGCLFMRVAFAGMGEDFLDALTLTFDDDSAVITGSRPASLPPRPSVKIEKGVETGLPASSSKKGRDIRERTRQGLAKRLKKNLDACPNPREWLEQNVEGLSASSSEVGALFSQFVQFPKDMEVWDSCTGSGACDRIDSALLQLIQGNAVVRRKVEETAALELRHEKEMASLRDSMSAERTKLNKQHQTALDRVKILEKKVSDREATLLQLQATCERLSQEQQNNKRDANIYVSGCLTDFCATVIKIVREDYPDYDINKFLSIDLRALGQRVAAKVAAKKAGLSVSPVLPSDVISEGVKDDVDPPEKLSGSDPGAGSDKGPLGQSSASETALVLVPDSHLSDAQHQDPLASDVIEETLEDKIPEDTFGPKEGATRPEEE
ncbi:uncharacterized protein LOC130015084 [Mercurialis annua]|uniref:uncharacterized protein LOC130015084 n=1 Tax=Mercurialis annua TaxID=3986 RepID=UPI0024AF2641|nr:uncharacterized protein LOC130015084 [Mercurialis annua]